MINKLLKGGLIMKINTYGLPMKGLKSAAGLTKNLKGYYTGHYVQISYNTKNGEILTDYHYNLGHNSWTQYHDKSIINIGNISEPATMQEIADMIKERLELMKCHY